MSNDYTAVISPELKQIQPVSPIQENFPAVLQLVLSKNIIIILKYLREGRLIERRLDSLSDTKPVKEITIIEKIFNIIFLYETE
ncbi:MAG: hypothetical protein ABRQ39_25535 [Candidatus Eremiobacterota bacterium]